MGDGRYVCDVGDLDEHLLVDGGVLLVRFILHKGI